MRLLTFIVFAFAMTAAQAEIVFAPGISYSKTEIESGGTTELEGTSYDLKLGYVSNSGLYLGAQYAMMGNPLFGDNNDGFAAGPTIGYAHNSGFYALFTYHLISEQDVSATSTLTDGMGPQIDIGWVFPLNHTFHMGPQITYRSIGYDKQDTGGASTDADVTITQILPTISFWFAF